MAGGRAAYGWFESTNYLDDDATQHESRGDCLAVKLLADEKTWQGVGSTATSHQSWTQTLAPYESGAF